MRALPLAMGAVTRDVRMMYRRTKRNAYLTAFAGLCFSTAYVTGIAAVWAVLAPVWGPAPAAAMIAGVMAGIGCVVLAVLSFLKYRERRRNSRRRAAQRLTAAAAVSILPRLTKSRGLLVVAALGGLAFLASQSGDQD
ncbi:hypothetical protein [Labrenzia sp. 011]|uniref:hypothetical protein n=1 Tax=Labrenzia sp. 011 TaxID=2171494 RepID=UPI00105742F1|nr:hypothetical protein [Labrenzia sp. 011]